jgi:hypothetical protein
MKVSWSWLCTVYVTLRNIILDVFISQYWENWLFFNHFSLDNFFFLLLLFKNSGQDTKMRFSIDPPINSTRVSAAPSLPSPCSSSSHQKSSQWRPDTPGCQKPDSSGFQQWHDAMRMVARLPGGVPPEFRRKVKYWSLTFPFCIKMLLFQLIPLFAKRIMEHLIKSKRFAIINI